MDNNNFDNDEFDPFSFLDEDLLDDPLMDTSTKTSSEYYLDNLLSPDDAFMDASTDTSMYDIFSNQEKGNENEFSFKPSSESSINPLQEGADEEQPKQLDIRLHSLDNKFSEVITIVVNKTITIANVRAYLMQHVVDVEYQFYTNGPPLNDITMVYELESLNARMMLTLRGLQEKKWKISVHIYMLNQGSFIQRVETVQLSLQATIQELERVLTPPQKNIVYDLRNHDFQKFPFNISESKIIHVLWGEDSLHLNINILAYNTTVRIFPNTFQSLERVLAHAIRKYAMKKNQVHLPLIYHPNYEPPSTWKRDVIQADLASTFTDVPFRLHTSSTNEIFIMPKAVNVAFLPYCLEEAIALPPQAYREVSLTTAFSKLSFVNNHKNINEFIVLGAPNINPVTMAQILEGLLRNKPNTILPLTIYIVYQMWTTPIDPKTVLFTFAGKTYTYQDYLTRKQHNILLHQPPYYRTQPGQSFLKHFETAYKTKLACLM